MSWIPPDPAVRVRLLQADSGKAPVLPVQEIPADLPDLQANLQPGERFTARIQQVLPESNSYRASIGGKEVALQLAGNAKLGDMLDLVVIESNPRLIRAQLASNANNPAGMAANAAVDGSETAQLSPAGQLIGKLLPPAGETPPSVPLNQGRPLLPAAPGSSPAGPVGSLIGAPAIKDLAAQLAPRLAQAATESGLFYEAHQALWVTGQHSTEALLKEPQAQHPAPHAQIVNQAANQTANAAQLPASADTKELAATNPAVAAAASDTTPSAKDLLQSIPAELRPLVQQQLDAAASQRLAWHGEVWPGQRMEWQISRDAPDHSPAQPQGEPSWQTSLALTTPGLGRVEAALGIAGNAVRIQLTADSADSADRMSRRLPALQAALQAAGLKLTGLQVVRNEDGGSRE